MRRAICYCEPRSALAGEVSTWKFVYTTNTNLQKGAKIKFDFISKGRDIDWEIPSTNLKKNSNVIYGVIGKNTIIPAKEVQLAEDITPNFEFTLPAKLEANSTFTIVVGSGNSSASNGNRAQTNTQRRRPFHLYVDPKGNGKYEDAEIFNLDIRGNILKNIRILTPSSVTRNKRFDVVVRFEDEYGNLTSQAPPETLIELSYEHLRENLSWKLFIPETGFISLPNLYFNEPGIYTIQLQNTATKETYRSSPIICFTQNTHNIYWGLLHGESERFDSTESIEGCLRYFRDERALNFYATSPFENMEETSNDIWKLITQNVTEFDETDRFNTFLGFQWNGAPGKEGARQFVYTKDNKQLMRKKDPKYSSLKNIYKNATPKDLISIPCWTMSNKTTYDFKDFSPEFERVVEIYNSWGSSECTKKEGNQLPISGEGKTGVSESAEGSIQKALLANCRFGFVAGGLDDRGFYTDLYEENQLQYPPGLTAIISTEHSKGALSDALYNRCCYATTGERIIIGLYLAGFPMGSELNTRIKQGLRVNRHLSGYVACTAKIASIEIIRNGKIIKTFEHDGHHLHFSYDDMIPIEKVVIDAKDKKPPFVYYYLRVTQEDGHTAWSSPIWVDLLPPDTNKKAPVKAGKKAPVIEFDDEDLDDDDDF